MLRMINLNSVQLGSTIHLLVASVALAALSSCTTFGRQDQGGVAGPSTIVVAQADDEDPTYSKHDRQYWLDQRQSTRLMPRLRGAMATGEAETSVQLAKARL